MKLNFRAAVADDIEELITLLTDTIQSKCANDYNQEQIDAWCFSARNIKHWESFVNDQFSIIAEIGNKIVGFGSLQDKNYIYFLYVHKDYLGLGIASKIYKQLAKKSVDYKQKQLTANVSKTALPFFKNKGFEIVKENKNIINQVTIINYNMIKQN